jgi:hydrogenase 3 maturation protease
MNRTPSGEWQPTLKNIISTANPDSKVALVGVGHPLRGDDYVGSYVAKKLLHKNQTPHIRLFDAERGVEAIISKIQSYKPKQTVFIDACHMNLPAGTVRMIPAESTDYPFFTTHSLPLRLLIKQFLRESECWVLAIEPKQIEICDQFSSTIHRVADSIITLIGSMMEAAEHV